MRLAYVQYVDSISGWASGIIYGPWIRILLSKRQDTGLLAHELLHVTQFWSAVVAFMCWLPFASSYPISLVIAALIAFALRKQLTLMAEVDAYRVQLRITSESLNMAQIESRISLFALFLSTRYRLNITQEYAIKLLSKPR